MRKPRTAMSEDNQQSGSVSKGAAITRVISFTSGKGGVGKTHTVVNVALALAEKGKSVLILDADLSLANVDVLMGLEVSKTLADFLSGGCELSDIVTTDPISGISLIPAASGVESIVNLSQLQRMRLMEGVEQIAWQYDYLLIDTPAGIGADVMFFNSASNEIALIISADPASLTDAYALVKVMSRQFGEREFQVIVNNVESEHQAKRAFRRLNKVVTEFLHVRLNYLAYIPTDNSVHDAVRQQRGVVAEFPSSTAARALNALGDKIDKEFHSQKLKGGMQFFFQRLLEAEAHGG